MKPALILLVTVVSYAQQSYEVSSIKPNTDGDVRFSFRIEPNGTLAATGITLKRLMMTAYNVPGFRIVGGPDWVDSRRWDVQAKADGVTASIDQIHQMLRAMLEERFQLHIHSETRNMPLYELVIDRNRSKVPTVKDAKAKPVVRVTAGSIELTNNTSATFASQLSYALTQPVIDKTGLSGNFDFAIRWTAEPGEDGGPADGPSIFTVIREQLGLRLKSARGPVDVVVIDQARLPDPN